MKDMNIDDIAKLLLTPNLPDYNCFFHPMSGWVQYVRVDGNFVYRCIDDSLTVIEHIRDQCFHQIVFPDLQLPAPDSL